MISWTLIAALTAALTSLLLIPGARFSGKKVRAQKQKSSAATEPGTMDAAMLADLMAALLDAGLGIEVALKRLATAVPGAEALAAVERSLSTGASWERSAEHVQEDSELSAFCQQLGFAHATGAPSAAMLRSAASALRAEQKREAERRAAELGVKMMLPLGACFLPAFILLGVVPVLLSMLTETLS